MAINYKRCPKCGSLNVIKILYGMPSHEAFILSEEGKIKLAAAASLALILEYFCKGCEMNGTDRMPLTMRIIKSKVLSRLLGAIFADISEAEIDFERKSYLEPFSGGVEIITKTIKQSVH